MGVVDLPFGQPQGLSNGGEQRGDGEPREEGLGNGVAWISFFIVLSAARVVGGRVA